nr:hypothetical protein Itr_chr05CG09250 [Ipomoea trifida]
MAKRVELYLNSKCSILVFVGKLFYWLKLLDLKCSRRPQSLLRLNPKDLKVFLWEICHDQLNKLMCM